MNSFTEENYLKTIYALSEKNKEEVTTNEIAEKLHTKAASVTDMLKKLADKKLINYKRYQGVTLSAQGKKIALNIVRKHRLWEVFLVEKLGFKWDEVHDIAEELEHIQSDVLVDKLDRFLNHPKTDPHGDPIPDSHGKFQSADLHVLAQLKANSLGVVKGVADHSSAFLQYLDKMDISLGNEIFIKDVIEYDHSLHIIVNKKQEIFVSHEVAKNILVSIKRDGKGQG